MKGLQVYILKKVADIVPTIVGISIMVFVILLVIPGNPAQLIQGEMADPEVTAALIEKWGLDQPPVPRYLRWMSAVLRLDFGRSLIDNVLVVESLGKALLYSSYLGLASITIAVVLSVPLGVLFGVKKNSFIDYFGMLVALVGISMPGFVTGLLLQLLFGRQLQLLPISGHRGALFSLESLRHLVLPAVAGAYILFAIDTRLVRGSILEVLHADYVRTARAKGLSELRALFRHALPNALIPVVTMFGLHFRRLFAGMLVVEIVFAWPGIGRLFFDAVMQRDYPVIQACALVIAVGVTLVNVVVDVLYGIIDPRIKLAGEAR
jgi:peptide/nickel transport system permease protein